METFYVTKLSGETVGVKGTGFTDFSDVLKEYKLGYTEDHEYLFRTEEDETEVIKVKLSDIAYLSNSDNLPIVPEEGEEPEASLLTKTNHHFDINLGSYYALVEMSRLEFEKGINSCRVIILTTGERVFLPTDQIELIHRKLIKE